MLNELASLATLLIASTSCAVVLRSLSFGMGFPSRMSFNNFLSLIRGSDFISDEIEFQSSFIDPPPYTVCKASSKVPIVSLPTADIPFLTAVFNCDTIMPRRKFSTLLSTFIALSQLVMLPSLLISLDKRFRFALNSEG